MESAPAQLEDGSLWESIDLGTDKCEYTRCLPGVAANQPVPCAAQAAVGTMQVCLPSQGPRHITNGPGASTRAKHRIANRMTFSILGNLRRCFASYRLGNRGADQEGMSSPLRARFGIKLLEENGKCIYYYLPWASALVVACPLQSVIYLFYFLFSYNCM